MAILIDRLPQWRVGEVDVTGVVKETAREVGDDDVSGLSAEMAYHTVLAMFPFLLFLTGLTSIIDNVFSVGNLTDRIVDKAGQVMPEDATSVIRSFTNEVVNADGGMAIVLGLVGAVWASSSAIGSAMKALNRAYDVHEDRGFVRRKLVALGLTLLFGGLMLAAAMLVATGAIMAGGIGEALGWESQLVRLWNWLTLPAALLLVTVAVALLYWLAPNTGHQFRWITPGAVLFTTGWVIASLAFAYYVANFASYNRTYGSIGAVIILLVWLHWTSFILLVGGELNAVLARRHDAEYQREEGAAPASGSRAQP
jgi:membrane protein